MRRNLRERTCRAVTITVPILAAAIVVGARAQQPDAEKAPAGQKYTVVVYKSVDGAWVRQNDRMLVTEDARQAQLYYLRAKNTPGWSAELYKGEPKPEDTIAPSDAPVAPAVKIEPGQTLPLLKMPPKLAEVPASLLDTFPALDAQIQVTTETIEEFTVEEQNATP
jgi:hypothetical protein